MQMIKVASSQIDAVGYDAGQRVLGVKFHRSGRYDYTGVPQDVYDGMLAAESVGKYFGANVKGKFDFAKHEQEKES